MSNWRIHQASLPSICLFLSILCCGAMETRAANSSRSRTATNDRAPLQAKQGATDPCSPAATVQDKSHALVSLVTRAKSQADTSDAKSEDSGALAVELWSSRVAAPDPTEDVDSRAALQRLIRQVRSLKFDDRKPAPALPAPAESQPDSEPSTVGSGGRGTTHLAQPAARASATTEMASALPSGAQRTLDDLRRNPSRTRDPLEAAELLFLSGRPAEAAPFYEEALRRMGPGGPTPDGDRTWVLFQLGNCLRETDTTKAQDTYMKLISEYPNSPWTELARAHGRLLTWYKSERPDQWVASSKP